MLRRPPRPVDSGLRGGVEFAVPRDFHEHEDHLRFFSEHFVKKGTEVARACLETVARHRELDAAAQA